MKFQNEYVTQKVAIELKQIGYHEECGSWYLHSEKSGISSTTISRMANATKLNWNLRSTRISAPTLTECLEWLRDNRIDVWVTTDCNVNEILGYTGHIHLLMCATLPNYFEVEMDNVQDNYDYYKVMEETIIKALTYL